MNKEIQQASQKAYAVADQVAKKMASKQKQIAQEILAELAKRDKAVWA